MTRFPELKIEASRSALFETPVVMANFKNAESLIGELLTAIRTRQAEDPEGVHRSNVGGWHSDVSMRQWGGAAAETLADKAIAMAKRLSAFAQSGHDDYHWLVQMWANVSGPGGLNHMHIHPGNLWSAVFYVDLGGRDEAELAGGEAGGEFYFEDPRFPIAAMHNTRFRFASGDGKPQPWQLELRPRKGDFIMFPAWLRHGVRPYTGNRSRISIALNVDAVPK